MAQPKDHLSDLDRHVQLLESKVNQLRASLTHWQQWYLEYSMLKEEVEQLPQDPPPHEQLRRIRRDFDGKLLSKKELNEIIGKNDVRETEKIVGVLSRRIDYVEQNIDSLTKLLEKEENRLAAASVIAQPDAGTDEESGLPFTDIIEELDEDGNVVNFRLQGGADVEPRIVEALKKAGIHEKDIPETEADLAGDQEASPSGSKQDGDKEASASEPAATSSGSKEIAPREDPAGRKKSVSFAEDTKLGVETAAPPVSHAAQQLERIMQKAKEQEAMDMSTAVIPNGESAEDSQLRREMLEYSMSEIGPVVAELQLEDDFSDEEDDMEWDGIDDDFEDETDDDEVDELGRSKRSVVTSDYIKRMQELEKRLNVQSAFTVGASETEPKKLDEGIGRIAVVDESNTSAAPPAPVPKGKKSVSFASQLDIAPDPVPQPPPEVKSKERKIAYVGDIVEKASEPETPKEPEQQPKRVSRFKKDRSAVPSQTHSQASPSDVVESMMEPDTVEEPEGPPKRVSRFKKDRAAVASPSNGLPPGPHQLPSSFVAASASTSTSAPVEPTPPEHQTLAHTVVERPVAPDPAEPDEMDDTLLYQAAAVEYNRLRNQLIQKQGGFAQQDGAIDPETGLVPLDEELGGPKRMSKFKAARLAKLQ